MHLHTLPWVSGSGINTFLSMKLVDSTKFRASLACAPGGRLEDLVRANGFPFHSIRHFRQPLAPVHDLLALFELIELFRRDRPGIVHTHNSKAGFLGRLAARIVGGIKVVHTVHGFAFHDREPAWRRALFRALEQLAFRWAARTIAISERLAEWGAAEGIGRREDYTIAWSGIEIERFADADRVAGRRALGVTDDAILIGVVSKLWEGKGHGFLIEAAAPLLSDRVRLVFIGEGPLEEELRARARMTGPLVERNVLFAGFQAETGAVTKALDIAALPSEFEGMGRVLLEAQAAGVPVVANRVGGVPDVVRDGGLLLAPGDRNGWREALRHLIEHPEDRRALGERGRAFVKERFSAATMARTIEGVYDGLLNLDQM
jgi:glycosyltransferase involved in cell wall biosynthesis